MKPLQRFGLFSIVVSMSLPASAQTTWFGSVDASWSNPANWSPGIPAEGSAITISDTTGNGLTLDDGSHSLGTITFGTTGTRTSGFTFQTTTANTLTISGGFTSIGNYTGGIGPRLRGNTILSADQTWQIGGDPGSARLDRGVAFNEVSSGNPGSLVLDADLIKAGSGQLTMGAVTVSGAGDVLVNDGSLKLNDGGSLPLVVGGPGRIIVNNTASLLFSQNSGSFNVTRPIQFNLASNVETGSGTNNKTGTFEIASDMEWTGAHTITNSRDANNANNVNFRFTGVMSGGGTITKTGESQLILAGSTANTHSGAVTVAAGELRLDKTGGLALGGDILVTGGILNIVQSDQLPPTATLTVTGGRIASSSGRTQTLAALNLSSVSAAAPSVSGFNVTGATTITAGTHELNSGQTFTTQSLSLSNNSTLRFVGNNTAGTFSIINVGSGGLALDGSTIQYGNVGNTGTSQLNLGGDLVSTGNSLFTAVNYNGPRIIDLQGAPRSFAVDGSLEIRTTIQNGTLVKSGAGSLTLTRPGSTADFSFTAGDVFLNTQAGAGSVALSGGSLHMDVGGATPATLTATGDFTSTGGTIELTADNGFITPGTIELVRYGGNLVGTPVINIPAVLAASRMNPVIDYGTGADSAITLTAASSPLGLVWDGSTGGIWDIDTTANFNSGAEKFYQLDSVTFDDTGSSASVVLDSVVEPTAVVFDHGATVSAYTVSGTGTISGMTALTKNGDGITVLATDNTYSGPTDILGGTLKVGDAGLTGSLGTGDVFVETGTTLEFARDGLAVFGNEFSGTGDIVASGPGTVALTSNNTGFAGTVSVTGGTLSFGDGGADGALGFVPVDIASGATLAIQRSGVPTVSNAFTGDGGVTIRGGSPILDGFNTHAGGVTVTDGGVLRLIDDYVLGALPAVPTPDSIRLINGGLKNQDSYPNLDLYRGVTISGEAYFTAGWSKSLAVNGPITGTGDIYINYDSGSIVFSDPASDWQGVLTLGADKPGATGTTGGILEIYDIADGGAAGPLGTSSADPANLVFNGGTLRYNGDSASTDRGFTLNGAGTVDVVYSTLTMSGLATGSGNLTKAGTGILVLTGSNDFVGEKIVSGGTLVVGAADALGDLGSFVRFNGNSGVLDLALDTSVAAYPLTIGAGNSGTVLANVATPGPGINHDLGAAALSTVTLHIAAGGNVSGGDPRITIPNLNLAAGASGTTTLDPTTANATIGMVAIESGNHAKTLSLGGTSRENEVSGTIADGINTVSLTKAGDSLWTVSGASSFTGDVVVDDGVLAVAHTNALGASTKTVIVAGAAGLGRIPELRLSGGISPVIAELQTSGAGEDGLSGVLRNISGDNTITITNQLTMRTGVGATTLYSDAGTLTINTPLVTANATNRALILDGAGNGVLNGSVADGSTTNLPVTKNGTGTWSLDGAHTYTGATTVNAGVLSLGQAALDDDAAVVIAADAILDLDFSGTDRVGSLTIDGDVKSDGVYDASTDPGFITGTGSIRVGAEPSGYGTWAAGFPFTTGVDDGPMDDPDGDGVSNLLEYVLGGIPVGAGASDPGILPTQTLNATDLVLTFRRSDASESDVTLKVQWSDDMVIWHDFATVGAVDALPQVDVTEDSPSAELDTVVVTIPRSTTSGGTLFARIQAVK
ncbi:MAG: autotransporter-associated beta strand repeat-containing protein [Verrucomicrobiae bacterium]|nr:autotransporter-associated beta strand repeat-containing protein [Verrucomicrobiae bacterium]